MISDVERENVPSKRLTELGQPMFGKLQCEMTHNRLDALVGSSRSTVPTRSIVGLNKPISSGLMPLLQR